MNLKTVIVVVASLWTTAFVAPTAYGYGHGSPPPIGSAGITGSTELLTAIDSGDVEQVEKLIEAGVKINEPTQRQIKDACHIYYPDSHWDRKTCEGEARKYMPLWRAVDKRNFKIVKLFLAKGADPKRQGLTPEFLMKISFDEKKWDFVRIIRDKFQANCYAGFLAARFGKMDLLDEFINNAKNSAAIDCVSKYNDKTALIAAARSGNLETAMKLIHAGANANFRRYPDSDTPLVAAARSENLELVMELLNEGATPDFWNKSLPITSAEIISVLIDKGVKIYFEDFFMAVNQGDFKKFEILANAVDSNFFTKDRYLALELFEKAVKLGQTQSALALIRAGLDVNFIDSTSEQSALTAAVDAQNVPVIEALLAAGLSLKPNNTTLRALNGKNLELTGMLLDVGATDFIDLKDTHSGVTPLISAVMANDKERFDLLIKYGAVQIR